jgi:hypothetical protein
VDPRKHAGKRPLPAAEEEEEEPKHEQEEEYPGGTTTFSAGGSSVVAPHAGSPSPEAYAQYYYSARADQDASAVASALAHVIRASPDQQQLIPPPQQGFVYPAEKRHAAPAEEEQGTLPSKSMDALLLLVQCCARTPYRGAR